MPSWLKHLIRPLHKGDRRGFYFFVIIALASLGIIWLIAPTSVPTPERKLRLGDASYNLETVRTLAAQEQGLSGRSGLATHTGMLFSYDQTAQRCMWMKDMKFDIDIIWLDSTNAITKIEPNLTPATYPQIYCADAQNVLELPSGTARQYGLKLGKILRL